MTQSTIFAADARLSPTDPYLQVSSSPYMRRTAYATFSRLPCESHCPSVFSGSPSQCMDRKYTGKQSSSPSHLRYLSSAQYSLVFLPVSVLAPGTPQSYAPSQGLLTGRMFDLGWYRLPQLFWSIVLVIAVFLIPECTKYWHFVLVQGIMLGVRLGLFQKASTSLNAPSDSVRMPVWPSDGRCDSLVCAQHTCMRRVVPTLTLAPSQEAQIVRVRIGRARERIWRDGVPDCRPQAAG